MLGREVTYVDNAHRASFLTLEDGMRLEYDGLLLALGTKPEKWTVNGY